MWVTLGVTCTIDKWEHMSSVHVYITWQPKFRSNNTISYGTVNSYPEVDWVGRPTRLHASCPTVGETIQLCVSCCFPIVWLLVDCDDHIYTCTSNSICTVHTWHVYLLVGLLGLSCSWCYCTVVNILKYTELRTWIHLIWLNYVLISWHWLVLMHCLCSLVQVATLPWDGTTLGLETPL